MQKRHPLCLIIIDGCNKEEFDEYINDHPDGFMGSLRNHYGEVSLSSEKIFRNERCWELFLTGSSRPSTGSRFNSSDYGFMMESLQHGMERATFYRDLLDNGQRVVSFDIPGPIVKHVNSIQVSGWGNETSSATPMSNPPQLIDEILSLFGDDPKQEGSCIVVKEPHADSFERSYQVPDIYSQSSVDEFSAKMFESISRRSDIIDWLANSSEWDLFIGVFTELHTANHVLWHLRNPLPGLSMNHKTGSTRELLPFLDEHLSVIKQNMKAECKMAVMTIDDTTSNSMDITSMVLLPELMYRWCSQGEALLDEYLFQAGSMHWKSKIWSCATSLGKQRLENPARLTELKDPLSWHPAYWYKSLWPSMKAFALPSVGDGYLRLNIKGRESRGLVSQDYFSDTVQDILRLLASCKNEYGDPVAKDFIVTRSDALEKPEIDPDIIVIWNADSITQGFVCENLDGMSFGPFPFFRSGGHRSYGSIIENCLFLDHGLGEALLGSSSTSRIELHALSSLIKGYYQSGLS